MKHLIHFRNSVPTSSILLGAFLVSSATSLLAQDKPRRPKFDLPLSDSVGAKLDSPASELFKPIHWVKVTPLCTSAIFNFDTRDKVNPTIRIGKTAAIQQPTGRDDKLRWGFNMGDEIPAYSAPRPRNQGETSHTLRLQSVLAPGTTYYYIFEAIDKGQLVQETGSFSTITRRVKVTYQRVKLLRGGDPTGLGDTMFQFFANYDAKTNPGFEWLGGRTTPLHIPFGESVAANKTFTLNNVDELQLAVNGYDEDFLTVGAPPSSGQSNSIVQSYPAQGAGHTNAGAINVAKDTFDLTNNAPGPKAVTVPFKLTSLPLPWNSEGQDVAFEVTGTYTIMASPFSRQIGDKLTDKLGGINIPQVTLPTPPRPGLNSRIFQRGTIKIP